MTLTLNLTYFSKTLALVITYEPWETGLSYFTCVFLVTRPFTPYHNFWTSDPDLEIWTTFQKLWPWSWHYPLEKVLSYFSYGYSLCPDLSHHAIIFDQVTLTFNFESHTLNVAIHILLPLGKICCLLTTLVLSTFRPVLKGLYVTSTIQI